ncbi:MAG: alkaline shock response membrane anchor protein AmaP [Actinomycetota bacterium]|nr:alkaline shock response membrane anchor protein AmaP [Actinomycetota bacterium]
MRVFNRIVMTLLFAGLFVLGVYMVVYGFDLFGRSLSSLHISRYLGALEDFVKRVESGNLSAVTIIILILLALLGLIWFIAELKPSAPRRVRMGQGTYVSRGVVEEEVLSAAEQVQDVLGSSVGVKARRSPGAQVDLEARVRRDGDLGTIRSGLRTRITEHLSERGLPVSKLNVKLIEADPRQTKTRVQ